MSKLGGLMRPLIIKIKTGQGSDLQLTSTTDGSQKYESGMKRRSPASNTSYSKMGAILVFFCSLAN